MGEQENTPQEGLLCQLYRDTNKPFFVIGVVLATLACTINPFDLDPTTIVKIGKAAIWLLQMINHHSITISIIIGGIFLCLAGISWQKALKGERPKAGKLFGDRRWSSSLLMGFFCVLAIAGICRCDISLLLNSTLMVIATASVIYFTGGLLDQIATQRPPAESCEYKLCGQKANFLIILGAVAMGLGVIVFPKIAHAASDPIKHTAVALSPSTAAYGFSYDQDSAQAARLQAYLNCQKDSYPANDCVVFTSMTEPGMYVLAVGEGQHAAVVGGKKMQEEAQQAAIAARTRQAKDCVWKHWWQNGEIK